MRLVKWLKDNGYDYLTLQGNPKKESASTTKLRKAACCHFKKYVINDFFKNLVKCCIIAAMSVRIIYVSSKMQDYEDMLKMFFMCVTVLGIVVVSSWVISRLVVSAAFSRSITAVSVKCAKEELPEWVSYLPEVIVDTTGETRWILIEVLNHSYAISYDTLNEITKDSDEYDRYLLLIQYGGVA